MANPKGLDTLDNPESWLRTVAVNRARSRARRRRRRAVVLASAAAVVTFGVSAGIAVLLDLEAKPTVITQTPSPQPSEKSQSREEAIVDSARSRPQQVAVDPDNPDRRAVMWWNCRSCGAPEGVVALTEDAFATRTLLPVTHADMGLAWVGERQVVLVDWAAGSAQLVGFDGQRRELRLGAEARAPADSTIVTAGLDDIWQGVWIDVASATAHPVPRPFQAGNASDNSIWRDANGLVWFGTFEDHHTIATSTDGGLTWASHDLGGGYFLPTTSAAKGVLAVLEYEDANRRALPLRRVWHSTDGGANWNSTAASAVPTAPIKNQGGVIRTDGRLLIHGPKAGLIVMDSKWTYFEPSPWSPGDGQFEFLTIQAKEGSFTLIGHPAGSPDLYVATNGRVEDWDPFAGR